ncbi:MAG: radical SAM protein [Oscillospiraceae bacterium]|jgi:uncharacterized radical SAM superfamily Fe-S cluster-containing enzyme|nr:radical SAM protein [Oscillospiraceae bacterium]
MSVAVKPGAPLRVASRTRSVCPVCLAAVDARIVTDGENYWLRKSCAEHGAFSAIVWRGGGEFADWWLPTPKPTVPRDCPADCADCGEHPQGTCCALVEVTPRCNLRCPVCFADAGDGAAEPTLGELEREFRSLAENGNTFVQLSGGEPTVRDDLPEIVALARVCGMETVQINSNGLRLAREPDFAAKLADAGADFIFMQFDGTRPDIYEKLRGADVLADKLRAVEVCARLKLGVTLVPTVVPGVNDDDVGGIIDFALSNSPAVRGVHFQPVSYFGRNIAAPEDGDRITLPEVLRKIEEQTAGKLKIRDFVPSGCDHPRCGFHGDFVVLPRGGLIKLTKKYDPQAPCCGDAHLKNRNFVSRRWKRAEDADAPSDDADFTELESFASRVRTHGFTITAMAFQDAWTLDRDRLARCSLHVAKNGRTVPFCAKYLTAQC